MRPKVHFRQGEYNNQEIFTEEKEQYGCDVAYCCTCILREFKTPKPKAILFQYPLHTLAPDIDPKRTEGSIEGNRVKGNITQTQKYAKVMAQSVHDDFDMVAKKLEKKNKTEKKRK